MRHQSVFAIFALLTFSVIITLIKAYPLLSKIYLVPQHRDVYFYPSVSLEVKHHSYFWEDLGSYRNVHPVLLFWFYEFLALFTNDICIYSRLVLTFMYIIASLVPSVAIFKLINLIEEVERRDIPFHLKLTISLAVSLFYSANLYVIKLYTHPCHISSLHHVYLCYTMFLSV